MEICKNKRSNQHFIYIGKAGSDEALLVTPKAEVKSLKLNLFTEIEEREESSLLQNKMVTEAQVKRFHEHLKDRSDEVIENIKDYFEQCSPHEKTEFIRKIQEIL
jgi:actin-like ATPase involved in cell morphogenesis